MKNKFEYTPLGKVAQIDISGVDKKVKENERQVRLCNFVDVYHNWSISHDLYDDFMIASANEREIDLFKIKKGQVAITKDSETRDDIGISTYIADDFQDVILGYHTALITPNEKLLNGKFLNAFFHTSTAKKHFENNASGSGQRYTLTNDSISSIKVPLYDIKTQEKIGNLFTLIDKKIVNNNKTNKILENLAQTIYDYWFVQYEFPNKEGNPYKSSGGEMIYCYELRKELPKDWCTCKISDILFENSKSKIQVNQARLIKGEYPYFTSGEEILYVKEPLIDGNNIFMSTGGNSVVKIYSGKCSYSTDTWSINADIYTYILFNYLKSINKHINENYFAGSGLKHLQKDMIKKLSIIKPTNKIISKYNTIVQTIYKNIALNEKENFKLKELRDFLLPLLMNGQVTIKEAEEKIDQTIKEKNITIFPNYDVRFELWLQNQGLAARGDIDRKTLREIFDTMDDNDK